MALFGSRRWTRQPPSGFADINPALPNPWLVVRTLGDRQQLFPAPAATSSYSGNASRGNQGELGVYFTGGGVDHTFAAQFDRQIYAVAVRFQQLTTATTQTIFAINGSDNGTQVRINTSEQLELLSQGSALLATSSSAPFGQTTRIRTLVAVCPSTTGSTFFYLDGALVLTYAGVVDNKNLNKLFSLAKRGGAGEALTGVIYDAVYWSGAGNLPTLAQAQEISQDYYGTIYAPRRPRKLILNTTGAATHTTTGALASGSATMSGAALHPHTTTGALSSQSATMSGAAVHPHTTTGALSSQSATMAGTAAHSVVGTHATTGALASDAATMAGTAQHLTLHTTTGALVSDAAVMGGTAQNGTVLPKMPAAGGPSAKRQRRRYKLEIDGETFDVASPEEAQQVFEQLRQAAEERAQAAAERAAKTQRRKVHKVVRDARKDLVAPQITAPPQFYDMAQAAADQVQQLYADTLQAIEIAALMRRREQDEEDDEEVLLLL